MGKLIVMLALIVLSRGFVGLTGVSADAPPPTTVSAFTSKGIIPPLRAELVHEVISLAAGAESTTQTRGGDLFVTVLDGRMILRQGGADSEYSTSNRSFRVKAGDSFALVNKSGEKARIFASTLLPSGTALILSQSGPIGLQILPVIDRTVRTTLFSLPPLADVVQVVQEFEPGAATPPHFHGGPLVGVVIEGDFSRTTLLDGRTVAHPLGSLVLEGPGREEDAIVRNDGPTKGLAAYVSIVPPGAAATTLLPSAVARPASAAPGGSSVAISPPATGDAGLRSGQPHRLTTELQVGFAVILFIGAASRRLLSSR